MKIDDQIVTKTALLVRKHKEKNTFVAGNILEDMLEKKDEDQEIWICDIILTPLKRYKLKKEYNGYSYELILQQKISELISEEVKK